jgi:dihydrofolate reductase
MRKLVYYVGTTIDGFIAGPDQETDFYPLADDVVEFITSDFPETLPTHVRSQMGLDVANKRFDTLVMGRGTYEPALEIGVTSPYRHLRQYVVSSTLGEITDPEVTLVAADPLALVRRLKEEGGLDIWLCGGGKLAGSLLKEIDELVIKHYPVVAGTGVPVFSADFRPRLFDLTGTRTLSNGTLVLTYART